eukprot:PhF_6_TR1503/c0_g3_i1/m.2725
MAVSVPTWMECRRNRCQRFPHKCLTQQFGHHGLCVQLPLRRPHCVFKFGKSYNQAGTSGISRCKRIRRDCLFRDCINGLQYVWSLCSRRLGSLLSPQRPDAHIDTLGHVRIRVGDLPNGYASNPHRCAGHCSP